MVEFCDECGGMMLPSKKDGIKVLKCKCGTIKPIAEDQRDSYKLKTKIEHSIREEVTNLSEVMAWKEKNLKSTIKNFKCPTCGYNKA